MKYKNKDGEEKEKDPYGSWNKIPYLFNKWKANIVKQYGKISTFRVWESTERYYCHIHCLIYFEESEFEVFKHINDRGILTYRISDKNRKKMKSYYPYFMDIQACESLRAGVKEVKKFVGKYLTKEITKDNKASKTNAMIWLTGKQCFAISKNFFKKITGEDLQILPPTNDEFIRTMCNSNSENIKWEYIGILSGKFLEFNPKIWKVDIKKPPDKIMQEIKRLKIEKIVKDNLKKMYNERLSAEDRKQ